MSEDVPDWMREFARCAPYIEAALKYDGGTHTVEDVMLSVAAGERQFWPGKQSAIVTELARHPRMSVLHFWLAGGDLQELETMVGPIERWAKEQGCTRITLAGRRGWARTFMRDAGYEPRWAVMAKDL
jgi:hypothetical protein